MLNATTLAIFNVFAQKGARLVNPEEGAVGVGKLGSSPRNGRFVGPNPRQYSLNLETWSITQCTCDFVSYASDGLHVDRVGVWNTVQRRKT